MSVPTFTSQSGATSLREGSNIEEFLSKYILTDLQLLHQAHPVLLTDAIKFCLYLRNFLRQELLHEIFSYMASILGLKHEALCSYSAIFVEKYLASKSMSVPPQQLLPFCETIVVKVLALLKSDQTQAVVINENEFLLKCILRIIVSLKESILPLSSILFNDLFFILQHVSKNPKNPRFSHFLFESLAGLVYFTYSSKSLEEQSHLEISCLPIIQFILQNDISEFMPYVFLLIAGFIEYSKATGIPTHFSFILGPVLTPALWSNLGNVPSLVRLLEAFIVRGSEVFVNNRSYFESLLGIFQTLLNSKMFDHFAFDIIKVCISTFPEAVLSPYLQPIIFKMLQRSQTNKTPKFTKGFALFLSHFLCFYQSERQDLKLINFFNSIQDK